MNDRTEHNDEIDLLSLVRSILATRTHLIIALLVLTALFWSAISLLNLVKPPINTASVTFYFTFKGAEKAEYPNESPFQPSDIIAPVILNKVYDQINGLEFIERDIFVSGFTISPYIPDIDLINAKYDLDKKSLSQVELQQLQDQLRQEVNQASSSAATLQFTTTDSSIPKELISHALKTVPNVWADHMVNNVGITEFDVTIFSEKVIDVDLIQSMDFLIAFEMLLDKTRLMRLNLDEVMKLPNGRVVQDSESKLTAPDLQKALSDAEKYRIAPLLTPIRNLGISRDPQIVELYFEDQLLELSRAKKLAENKRDNLENAFAIYVNNQAKKMGGSAASQGALGGSGGVIPQFGSEFLDRIVDLTNSGVDIEFRQEMTDKQIKLSNELSEIESEVDRIREVLQALDTANGADGAIRELYVKKAETQLPLILTQLSEYFVISNRIYQTVSENALGNTGSMFRFISDKVRFETASPILNQNNMRNYLIAIFLTIVFVVPISMTRNALRNSPE